MDLETARHKMEKALAALSEELTALQAGRATPAMVEKIMVEAYDTKMPLVELATISAPEPNQLLITPFDQAVISNIQAALNRNREIKLSSIVDENLIRVQIPPLTAERREEFVRLLKQKMEAGKVMIRQVRQNERQEIHRAFEDGEISEDAKYRFENNLQELTDEFTGKIDQMGETKKKELRSV